MKVEAKAQTDISDTEYQKAINKLRDSEDIINRSPAVYCIWYLSEDFPVEYISANVSQFGYEQDDLMARRVSAKSLIHPDDQARIAEETAQFLLTKPKEAKHEFRLVTKKGECRWVEVSVTPFFNGNGEPEYFQGVVFDIHERKIAQLALQESENIYRTIFENTGTAMAISDEKRHPILINDQMEKLTGYTRKQLTAQNTDWSSFTAPDDVARLKEYHRLRLANPEQAPKHYEYKIITNNGETKDVFMTSTLIPGTRKSLVSMMDITALKKAEAELGKSEGLLKELLSKSSDIVAILSVDGAILYASPSVRRVLGYDETAMNGKCVFDLIHPDDLTMVMTDFAKVITTENVGLISSFRFRRADGSWIYLEALGNNCLNNPAINGIIIDARDITDRKNLQQQLLQSQKMEAIGTLAGGIAHNFNNILMGIQGQISLMLMNFKPQDQDYSRLINAQTLVKSAADLTVKLLGFARGGKYESKTINFNDLIIRTSDIFGSTRKEISIHNKLANDLWATEADRVQLEQVLLNMYVNAWQAMTETGDIFIETANTVINKKQGKILAIEPGHYVRISITDTGIGMDEQTRSRIFEPFFTTKGKEKNMGLGLPSAYGIIKEHKGAIEVFSELGKGATFNIYLPASSLDVIKDMPAEKPVLRGKGCILLVEDEEAVADVCRDILAKLGYDVFVALSGKEALEIYNANREKIHLVILDMIMPQMSGGAVFEKLREINPACKVILSTGYAANEQAMQIMQKGCSALIQKPFRINELSQKVKEVLNQH